MSQPARILTFDVFTSPKFVEATAAEPRALYPNGAAVYYGSSQIGLTTSTGTLLTSGQVFTSDVYLVAAGRATVDDTPSPVSTGGGSGHTIEDEGAALAARASLNFTGAGVTATDSGGKTVITIPGGTTAPTIVNAGSLGASRTQALSSTVETWVTGTLTADHTLTVTPATGGRLRFFGLQDATGGRTLTVSDGTNTQAVSVPLTAGVQFEVVIYSTDGSALICEVFGGGPGLLDPYVWAFDWRAYQFGGAAPGLNVLLGHRVRIPYTGRLRDLYTFTTTTLSTAHVQAAVFDTGQTTPAFRTRLWQGSSVLLPASNNNWVSLGDPNLPVVAGQQLDLAMICDSATPQFARNGLAASNMTPMPSVFQQPNTSVRPVVAWTNSPGSFTIPATLDDATVPAGASSMFLIMGRIA